MTPYDKDNRKVEDKVVEDKKPEDKPIEDKKDEAKKDDGKKDDEKKNEGKKDDSKDGPKKDLPNVFFEIWISGEKAGKVIFKLYDDIVPQTAANFRGLCTGKNPDSDEDLPKDFGYKGTAFHRIIPGFMVQGGDFERMDGTGGQSVYGAKFPDENFKKRHDRPGLLSMANSGPDCNGSQFFITLAEHCDWLNGKHVVFGEVVEGLDVVKQLEKLGSREGRVSTSRKSLIKDCGIV